MSADDDVLELNEEGEFVVPTKPIILETSQQVSRRDINLQFICDNVRTCADPCMRLFVTHTPPSHHYHLSLSFSTYSVQQLDLSEKHQQCSRRRVFCFVVLSVLL